MCRRQGYDNDSTKSGIHTGGQKRICEVNPIALFVPCANDLLNLCGVNSFVTVAFYVTFFLTLESVCRFFSGLAHRWDVQSQLAGISVERLCETRWSAPHYAVKTIIAYVDKIVEDIEALCSPEENNDIRS
ncbi:hypothetical protein PR048_016137 [Dryococelus australis]|uniref:Uncharacterized protein n=1 Tax=Dryococelus australis TaxID=614101 RepID=A0ABQ9HIW4_9NEOP|nr:hypothetical protein PR048_016137 [Dryococelus australis]